jgi:Flp pilus assembly pilin Flp
LKKLNHLILIAKVWSDTRAQDLIEYALLAGFVAVAAGALMPGVSTSISRIFSNIASAMKGSASTGGS